MQVATRTRAPGHERWFAMAVCGAVLSMGSTSRAETPSDPSAAKVDAVAPSAAPVPVAPAPPPLSRRTLAWIVLGTGATLAVSSVVTGALATADHSDAKSSCAPTCSDAQLSPGRTLATTSTVLTGAAVVATAIGLVLFFQPTSDGHATATNFGLDVTPSAVHASTTWTF